MVGNCKDMAENEFTWLGIAWIGLEWLKMVEKLCKWVDIAGNYWSRLKMPEMHDMIEMADNGLE